MASLRPRAGLAPASPHIEPDTPAAHYTENFDYDEKAAAAAEAHIHEHAPGAASPPRGWRRKAGKIGLGHRAWLVLALVAVFVLLSKMFLPHGETHSSKPLHQEAGEYAHLIPHDYLNASETNPAPFEFCPVFGPNDPIAARRGQFELLRSRLHVGTGARVQRVLTKAMSGMPVTISVLGGSVSACAGAGDDPVAPDGYPARFFNWWNSVFPHPDNELTNGASKRTDSAYYAYCSSHHLPDKTDLVVLEFDAADPNDQEWLNYFELLVRSILVRPEAPAVVILGHFSPQVQAQNGFAGPELLHNAVAQFYDVPHISAKGVMYDSYLEQPHRAIQSMYTDSHHANKDGHDLIADVLISYFMSQICAGWSTLLGYSYTASTSRLQGGSLGGAGSTPQLFGGVGLRPGTDAVQKPEDGASTDGEPAAHSNPSLEVPRMRLNDRPTNMATFREFEPFCVSASDLVSPLPPSIFYGSGWAVYHPPQNAVTEDRHYWYADKPESRLRIPLRIGAGDVGIYFLQSPPDKPFGTVRCWVDDNIGGAKTLVGTNDEIEEPMANLVIIDQGVSLGSHFVECMLDGEPGGPPTPFKILGIFTT